MDSGKSLHDSVLAAVPSLRAYAVMLAGNKDRADDLVQDTLLRAIRHIATFQPGTNMQAWLMTILHNCFVSDYRKSCREARETDGIRAASLACQPHQEIWMAFQDIRRALARLPLDQRDAIVLVCALGFTYGEAADICGCAVGTIKSRISRARAGLASALMPSRAGGAPRQASRRSESASWRASRLSRGARRGSTSALRKAASACRGAAGSEAKKAAHVAADLTADVGALRDDIVISRPAAEYWQAPMAMCIPPDRARPCHDRPSGA